MHMADALVSPAVAGTLYACSTITTAYSARKVHLENDIKKVPTMGVMGAFIFASQMINFTIPGTGASGHLCGGVMAAAILGPHAGFLTMLSVLVVQCLLFADGGILALGANIWNMAFYGCYIGGYLIWRLIMKDNITRNKIIVASILGSIISLQLGAFSVTLETLASGITELPFMVFLSAMQPIHLVIGLVEGLITASVLVFVYEARPELLYGDYETGRSARLSAVKTLGIILVVGALIAGGFSIYASSNPDGLEWSIERVMGEGEPATDGDIYDTVANIQESTALLPDYSFKNSDGNLETRVSGLVGTGVVVAIGIIVAAIFKLVKKKNAWA